MEVAATAGFLLLVLAVPGAEQGTAARPQDPGGEDPATPRTAPLAAGPVRSLHLAATSLEFKLNLICPVLRGWP